jgi:hypothetical protein
VKQTVYVTPATIPHAAPDITKALQNIGSPRHQRNSLPSGRLSA